jgi:benzoyl-CoA reductase subunit BamC
MKELLVNNDKCSGCRSCEVMCSFHHYGRINPRKSRVRVIRDFDRGHFYPLIAGPFTEAECTSKYSVIIGGKEYPKCTLCRASCSSRPYFREPDTGILLKCDMCGDPPDPMCVKVCGFGALSLIEVENKEKEEEK